MGTWTYRSFRSNPDLAVTFNDVEFGRGTITIHEAPMGILQGTIDPSWLLELNGVFNYGDPYSVLFQGKAK